MSASDHELLTAYVRDGSQAAFTELVRRHLNLVYSAARRQVRSSHAAEEIAQGVFTDLARNASQLNTAQPLVAWLHLVTRRTAIDWIRRESRRIAREQQVAELPMHPSSDWTAVEPLLDEAVQSLPAPDRTAILLRYFESKSLHDVGAALGASDDAAQKRIARALERLRGFLLRRGVAVTAAGLASDLSAHAIEAAPLGLGATISSAGAVSAAASTAALETSRIIAMTTLQKSLGVAALVAVAGAGFYQARLVARQTDEIAALGANNNRAAREIVALRASRETVSAQLKSVEQRIDARLAQPPPPTPADAALEAQMQNWLAQITRLREFIARRPEWDIPELKLLTDQDWFNAAATDPIESEEQFRRTTARLRDLAVSHASQRIKNALNAYLRAHDGVLPITALALAPHFDPPLDPAILARYETLQNGRLADVPQNQWMRLLAPKPADPEYDSYSYVGTNGYGNSGVAMNENIREARRRFANANGGQRPTSAEQLLPYLKWPVSAEALRKHF